MSGCEVAVPRCEQTNAALQRLWPFGSPQRTSSRQLSIGTPGSNVLDHRAAAPAAPGVCSAAVPRC